MIEIKLRKCLSEANRLTKTFDTNADKTINGNFRGEVTVLRPVFVIETTDDLSMYNYCEIATLHRKYFVTIRAIAYKLWEISCVVDVLSTYSSGILASEALVKRTDKTGKNNFYMNDGVFFTEQREIITYLPFLKDNAPATMGTESYYLVVAGG